MIKMKNLKKYFRPIHWDKTLYRSKGKRKNYDHFLTRSHDKFLEDKMISEKSMFCWETLVLPFHFK